MRKSFEDLHSGIILLKESLDPVKYMSTLLLISVSSELLPVSSIEQRIWGLGDFFLIIKMEFWLPLLHRDSHTSR